MGAARGRPWRGCSVCCASCARTVPGRYLLVRRDYLPGEAGQRPEAEARAFPGVGLSPSGYRTHHVARLAQKHSELIQGETFDVPETFQKLYSTPSFSLSTTLRSLMKPVLTQGAEDHSFEVFSWLLEEILAFSCFFSIPTDLKANVFLLLVFFTKRLHIERSPSSFRDFVGTFKNHRLLAVAASLSEVYTQGNGSMFAPLILFQQVIPGLFCPYYFVRV